MKPNLLLVVLNSVVQFQSNRNTYTQVIILKLESKSWKLWCGRRWIKGNLNYHKSSPTNPACFVPLSYDIFFLQTRMCHKYMAFPFVQSFSIFSGLWKLCKISNLAVQLERSYHKEHMCTKFQVDWISTLSKTTSIINFNLKQDRRTDQKT